MERSTITVPAIFLAALFTLVIAAGALQYRWIEEASDAQETKTLSRVRDAVERVANGLDTEVARAALVFTSPGDAGEVTSDTTERAWAAWSHDAPWPRLVSGVTRLKATGDGWQTRTWGDAPVFDPAAVIDIDDMRLDRTSASPADDGLIHVRASPRVLFIAGAPGIVLPLPGIRHAPPHLNWIVVRFDGGYLTSVVFPQIVERSLAPDDRRAFTFELRPADDIPPGAVVVADQFSYRPACLLGQPHTPGLAVLRFRGGGDAARRGGRVMWHSEGPGTMSLPALLRADGRCQSSPPTSDQGLMRIAARRAVAVNSDVFTTYRKRNNVMSAVVLAALLAALSALVLSTERARRLARLQTVIAAGISHELRTPLASLSVAADHLKNGHVENVDQARRYGDIIAAQSRRLRHIVDQTLALTSLTERSRVFDRQPLALVQLIDAAIAGVAAAVSEAGMTIESHTEIDTPPISADPDLAQLCLTNLIENAMKYARAGQWIGISARRRRGGRSIVELTVEDRGPGIDVAEAAAAVEPFYRGSAARRSRQSGIGLGLAIVRSAVEAHDGWIEIDRAVPHGCRVRMFFPAADEPGGIAAAKTEL